MSSLGSPNPLLIGGAKDYEIERSLRFNAGDSPVLTYTPTVDGDRKKLTWSFWWKRSKIDSAEYMITAFNDTNTDRIAVTSDNQLHIELKNGNATEAEFHSKRLFRDPSAWYHIVVAFDTTQATASDRIKAYVNNERITEWDTNDEISQHYYMDGFNTLSKAHDIGAYSGGSGSHSGFCNTYLADIIFIDGIQSTPSDFGETHEKTGQWVPKKYEGTYGLVGTGSYHTGSQVTGSAAFFGGFNLFDGDLNTSCGPISLSTDNSITFTPTTGIAYSSSIRIYAYGAGSGYDITNTFELNGGSPVTFAGDAGTNSFIWVDVASGSGTLTSLKVRLQRPGTSYVRWAAIEIDGTILKTNGVNGYHLNFSDNSNTTAATLGKDSSGNGNNWTPNNFSVATGIGNDSVEDTPTNNFCTLNILGSGIDGSGCDISQGGLYVARNSGSNRFMDSTFTLSSGKWYWEAKTGSSISDYPRIGIWNRGGYQNRLNYPGEGNSGVASDDHVRGWGANGTSFGASGDSASGLPTFSTSEVLMFAMDMDSGKIWFGKDGTWYTDDNSTTTTAAAIAAGTATPKFADLKSGAETQFRQSEKGWTPIAHMNSGDTWEFNFGSRPFAHTPPAGFKSICTKNLPEPDVIKPSEYVGGLKYTGNDFVGTRTFTGLDFNPDLIWHKGRTEHNTHWNCYDKVRGITAGKEILLNSSAAEGAEDGATYGYLSEYTGDGSPGAGGFSHVTGSAGAGNGNAAMTVSYTHLTLPTIYSV